MQEPDFQRQERIEAYVNGKLDGEELRAFESALAHDERLRAEVEVERTLSGTLQREQELRFRDLVQRVSGAQEQKATKGGGSEAPVIPIQRGRWKWLAAAASVAALVGVAVKWWSDHPDGSGTGPDYSELAYVEAPMGKYRGAVRTDVVDTVFMRINAGFRRVMNDRTTDSTMVTLITDALSHEEFAERYGPRTRLMLARLHLAASEPDEALAALEASSDATLDPCAFRFYRAVALFMVGRKVEGAALLTERDCPEIDSLFHHGLTPG